METLLLSKDVNDLKIAAKILKKGGLVAIPTETVYGLAANAFNKQAVRNIFIAKGRDQDNPLILHVDDIKKVKKLVKKIPDKAMKLAKAYWPGPLTIIMKKSKKVNDIVTCGLDTVAIRIPENEIARKLITLAACPLAAPSANISGGVSPTTAQHCIDDLNGKIDAIVDGGKCNVGLESTIILITDDTPRILRPGFITKTQIEKVIGKVNVDNAVLNPPKTGETILSPGLKYKHYSPKAKVILINSSLKNYIEYVNSFNGENVYALCFEEDLEFIKINKMSYGKQFDSITQAANLFEKLRELDDLGAKTILARMPKSDGVGLAVLNRLLRASAFNIINI